METKTVRLNTEKTIENENYKIKIGTTNKINPQVIYVEGKTFIKPEEEKIDYSRDISDIKRQFNKTLQDVLKNNDLFNPKYILDFQVAQNGISTKKKSFLTFQFLMKQKNEKNILKLKEVKNVSEEMIANIMDGLTEHIEKHNFAISKTKR